MSLAPPASFCPDLIITYKDIRISAHKYVPYYLDLQGHHISRTTYHIIRGHQELYRPFLSHISKDSFLLFIYQPLYLMTKTTANVDCLFHWALSYHYRSTNTRWSVWHWPRLFEVPLSRRSNYHSKDWDENFESPTIELPLHQDKNRGQKSSREE